MHLSNHAYNRRSDAYRLSGALLALAVSAGTSAGTVVVKRMDPGQDFLAVAAWQLILGSLPLLVLAALVEGGTSIVWSGEFVGLLLFLSLVGPSFATVLCYWLL